MSQISKDLWGVLALRGIVAILFGLAAVLGVYLIRHAGIAFAAIVLVVGLVLIARGIVDIFSAIFEEEAATSKTILVITGVLSVIVGVALLMQPVSAGVAFVWILGLYALITGPMLIALAYDIKK